SNIQNGLIMSNKESKYYTGTAPHFPTVADRTTNFTYYTGGTNNINRPATITVCNSSGTDADCLGGGSKVSRTVVTYDVYTSICGSSGLSSITGIANHDDTNFGTSYTPRGNATQMQRWVSGSTYISKQLAYDTTGQIAKTLDGNRICSG